MFALLINKFGPLNSGTLTYVANFLPADVPSARGNLDFVLARQGGAVYSANSGLDVGGKGFINVADMAHFVARAANSSFVQSLIQQAYAMRGTSPPDPVFGTDFGAPPSPQPTPPSSNLAVALAGGAVILGAAGLTAWYLRGAPRLRLPRLALR
jgi:hypothetical protein